MLRRRDAALAGRPADRARGADRRPGGAGGDVERARRWSCRRASSRCCTRWPAARTPPWPRTSCCASCGATSRPRAATSSRSTSATCGASSTRVGAGDVRADRARARLHGRSSGRVPCGRWWAGRPLRVRITLVVGAVALVALLALSRLGDGAARSTRWSTPTDQSCAPRPQQAVAQLAAGATRGAGGAGGRHGRGGPSTAARRCRCDARQVGALAAGEGVTTQRFSAPRRWVAVPARRSRRHAAARGRVGGPRRRHGADAPDGAGSRWSGPCSRPLVVAGAAWVATRAALRSGRPAADGRRGAAARRPAAGARGRATRCGRWPRSSTRCWRAGTRRWPGSSGSPATPRTSCARRWRRSARRPRSPSPTRTRRWPRRRCGPSRWRPSG